MKLSDHTVGVLKNFATISPSLIMEPGNVIRTISPRRGVVARAEVADTFPKPFAIYNLAQFLSAASIGSSADFAFGDKSVVISSGAMSVTYWYANPDLIAVKPSDVTLPSEDVKFDLPGEALKDVIRGAATLSLPSIFLAGGKDGVFVGAGDVSHGTSNSIKVRVSDPIDDHVFNTVFAVENIKMIPATYNVVICRKGVAKFDSADTKMTYYVASSKDSTFA